MPQYFYPTFSNGITLHRLCSGGSGGSEVFAAVADQWVKEHPEEWKELERVLYYSEANFHKRLSGRTNSTEDGQ